MSKTLTTYEALKANETKRVRPVGADAWLGVGEMIKWLNRGLLDVNYQAWRSEESMIEQWVIVSDDEKVVASADTQEEAQAEAKGRRIVHLREVRS